MTTRPNPRDCKEYTDGWRARIENDDKWGSFPVIPPKNCVRGFAAGWADADRNLRTKAMGVKP